MRVLLKFPTWLVTILLAAAPLKQSNLAATQATKLAKLGQAPHHSTPPSSYQHLDHSFPLRTTRSQSQSLRADSHIVSQPVYQFIGDRSKIYFFRHTVSWRFGLNLPPPPPLITAMLLEMFTLTHTITDTASKVYASATRDASASSCTRRE